MRYGDHFSLVTWNLYNGADLTPIITARAGQCAQWVSEVFQQFLATDFPERVKQIAFKIALKQPDIIGLQEAELCQLLIPRLHAVTYDFVQLLLAELAARGLDYKIAALNQNHLAELPDSNGNLVRLLDRDAILVREGRGIKIINRAEANFAANLTIRIAGQPFEIIRGWSAVDFKLAGNIIRLINTHLEYYSAAAQIKQAQELLAGPAATNLPLILMGDLNSAAGGNGTPTYRNFIKAGFYDAWRETKQEAGFTGCHSAGLLNAVSGLNERIDFILFKNGLTAITADLVGDKQEDRTLTGLWPSDHAGVAAKLGFKRSGLFYW